MWTWSSQFLAAIRACVPSKLVPIQSRTPWVNFSITKNIAKWESYYHKYKSNDWLVKYKTIRNRIVFRIREAKRTFFNNLAGSTTTNPKKFWSGVRQVKPRSALSTSQVLVSGTSSASTDVDKATLLYEFFASCFNPFQPVPSFSLPSSNDCPNEFDCVPEEVADLLHSTKLHASMGPDGISAWTLKTFANELSPSVASIFNLFFTRGCLPASWKLSNIVPIPKIPSPKDVSSYHPISLLPIISKTLERHIHRLLTEFLTNSNLLSDSQFGFRRCTSIPLLQATHQWHTFLDTKSSSCLCLYRPQQSIWFSAASGFVE